MKHTESLAQALVNLRGNRDFAVVLEAMKEHEAAETQRCRDAEGTALFRAQGASKALEWWRAAFAEAPALLEKFKQPKR